MKKSLLALAVSLVAVSGAHAAWDTGYDSTNVNVGNGEALFQAFDNVKGVSYALDLGVRYDDLVSGAAFNGQTKTVDLSVFTLAGSSLADVSWQIVAGSGDKRNGGATANFSHFGYLITVNAAATASDYNNAHTTTLIQNLNKNQNDIRAVTGDVIGAVGENNAVTESSAFGPKFVGDTSTLALASYPSNNLNSLDTFGAITGETVNLWRFGFGVASSAKQSNILGSITLSGNTLTFVTAPTVPVPAAAWLMGSALLGLGGVARRRNKA